jgi:hypothetical protein
MTTETKLLRTTYLFGLIPLFVGLTIFLSWWVGKYWFLTTIHRLEMYGIYWVLISIPIGLVGLLAGIVFLFRTNKNNSIKGVGGLGVVFLNIPVLIGILALQNDIEKRAYVKIHNLTESHFDAVVLVNSETNREFYSIDNGESQTEYFYPKYVNEFDSAPEVDKVKVKIRTNGKEKTVDIPTIYKGECVRVFLDKDFSVTMKRQFDD